MILYTYIESSPNLPKTPSFTISATTEGVVGVITIINSMLMFLSLIYVLLGDWAIVKKYSAFSVT